AGGGDSCGISLPSEDRFARQLFGILPFDEPFLDFLVWNYFSLVGRLLSAPNGSEDGDLVTDLLKARIFGQISHCVDHQLFIGHIWLPLRHHPFVNTPSKFKSTF